MAVASEHLSYYMNQEKKRDEIMKKKLESQKKRFADYSLKEIKNKHFVIWEKENFTKEDDENGMSYRVDFYVGNTFCNIFTSSGHLEESINEVERKFSNGK